MDLWNWFVHCIWTLRVALGGAIVIAGVAVILVRRTSAAELGPAPEAGARRSGRER